MKYLVLWSGTINGARKRQIDSMPAHLVGHYVNGVPMTFDGAQFRECIAKRHRRAWDEGRAQAWFGDRPDSPWSVHIYGTRNQRLATYYCQPLTRV